MKKKIMSFFVGVLGFASIAQAAPGDPLVGTALPITASNVYAGGTVTYGPNNPPNGIVDATVTGGAVVPGFSPVTQGTILMLNSLVTFNGQLYGITTTPAAGANNDLVGLFNLQSIPGVFPNDVTININGVLVSFGTGAQVDGQAVEFTLVPVPFDFGISAVLGAGAIAAVKTARRRRKEQEVAVA